MQCHRLVALWFAACLACGADDQRMTWLGSVDTTVSGTIVVSNPAIGIWDSASAWRLSEDLRIGAIDGEDYESFSSVSALRVDGRGRIYVLDQQSQEIRVFEKDGRHLRTFGRKGQGPGEFASVSGMDFDARDRLWVVDVGTQRYSVFDTSGAYVTSYPRGMTHGSFPWRGAFVEPDQLWDRLRQGMGPDMIESLVRFDSLHGHLDTLQLPRYATPSFVFTQQSATSRGRYMMNIPFAPLQHWLLTRQGHIWIGISDEMLLHRVNLAGDTTLTVRGVVDPVPVSRAERDDAMEMFGRFDSMDGEADPSQVPSHKPAFRLFTVDDEGHVWVFLSLAENQTGTDMAVFDADGHYLGRVTTDVSLDTRPHPVVRHGAMYGVEKDEFDVPYVVRLRIDRR